MKYWFYNRWFGEQDYELPSEELNKIDISVLDMVLILFILHGGFMGYRIASFNMKNFGMKAGYSRDLNKIAEIILQEEFDIVAFSRNIK